MERGGTSSAETWDSLFSDFYLRAYASDERDADAGEQALAAARLAGCPAGGDVLDVPCGFGRHSIPLAQAGYRVVGTDRSQALLDEARRRAGGGRWPKLIQADYRKLPFADASFDAALNLYTSIGFLGDEEDTKALSEIGRVLRPGAPLVIETMHRDRLVTLGSDRHWELLGEGRLLVAQTAFDHASGVAQTTQTLIDASSERESRTWSIRVYSATELVAMLDRAGFVEAKCYGDLDGGPLGTATRLVIVARTPAPWHARMRDPRLVWSSGEGDLRRSRDPRPAPAGGGGRVKVRREVAGRRGKPVTTISGVPLDDAGLRELAGRLKKRCGVGGSAKGGVIELQGDHRDVIVEMLRGEGYDVVLAGG